MSIFMPTASLTLYIYISAQYPEIVYLYIIAARLCAAAQKKTVVKPLLQTRTSDSLFFRKWKCFKLNLIRMNKVCNRSAVEHMWPSTRKLCIFTCLNIHLIYYNEPLIRWFFSLFRSVLCSDSEVDGNCFTNISFSTSLFRFCLMCLQQTNRLFSALFNFNGVVSTTKPLNLKPHQQYYIARWRDHYYSPAVCSTYSNKRILCLANVINIEDVQ